MKSKILIIHLLIIAVVLLSVLSIGIMMTNMFFLDGDMSVFLASDSTIVSAISMSLAGRAYLENQKRGENNQSQEFWLTIVIVITAMISLYSFVLNGAYMAGYIHGFLSI